MTLQLTGLFSIRHPSAGSVRVPEPVRHGHHQIKNWNQRGSNLPKHRRALYLRERRTEEGLWQKRVRQRITWIFHVTVRSERETVQTLVKETPLSDSAVFIFFIPVSLFLKNLVAFLFSGIYLFKKNGRFVIRKYNRRLVITDQRYLDSFLLMQIFLYCSAVCCLCSSACLLLYVTH